MKKIYLSILLLLAMVFTIHAQSWVVYDATYLPDADSLHFVPSNTGGSTPENTFNTIVADPDDSENSLLEMIVNGDDARYMWRHDLPNSIDDTITVVMRVKGITDTLDRVMELDLQQAGYRERLYINSNGTYELKESNIKTDLPGSPMDWQIYRFTKVGDSVNFYFNENPVPLATVKTPTASTSNYLRFGDGNGSNRLSALVDWVIWDTTGAYAPGEGEAFPDSLSLSTPAWKVYDAKYEPLDNPDPVFVSSSGGTPEQEILVNPESATDSILQMIVYPNSNTQYWRYNFPNSPQKEVTLVARVRAITDTLSKVMEFDFQHDGLRERLYIYTDNTFRLNEAGLTDTLSTSVMNWHIYRITTNMTDSIVTFYFDENPVPLATVKATTTSGSNYFRFGDGNSSSSIAGQIDWIIWDETGAYAPDRGLFLPDTLISRAGSDDALLMDLAADAGTLDPAFDPGVDSYDLVLPAGVVAVNLTATASDSHASVEGAGAQTSPSVASIVVTAEDGVTQMTYTVNISTPASDVATLSALTTSDGTLNPAFDAGTTTYALELSAGTNSVTFTATATDANASVAGDGEFTGIPGTAEIVVTAEDGTTTMTYTVNVSLISGLDKINAENPVIFYPNPVNNQITIESADPISRIVIYNATGIKVLEILPDTKSVELQLKNLRSGIYFIKIESNELIKIGKITKN